MSRRKNPLSPAYYWYEFLGEFYAKAVKRQTTPINKSVKLCTSMCAAIVKRREEVHTYHLHKLKYSARPWLIISHILATT